MHGTHCLIVEGADAAVLMKLIKANPRNSVHGPMQGDYLVVIDGISGVEFGCCQVGSDTSIQVCEHYRDPAFIHLYQKIADYLKSIGVCNQVRVQND